VIDGAIEGVLHELLDHAGVDRANRAESARASRIYSVAERVGCLVVERDRAVEAVAQIRDSHRATVRDNGELRRRIEALQRGA
jgi:hypothetical protein